MKTDLQALITGALIGSLIKQDTLAIEVDMKQDDDGNYLPEFEVRGLGSGDRLLVKVEALT